MYSKWESSKLTTLAMLTIKTLNKPLSETNRVFYQKKLIKINLELRDRLCANVEVVK